MRLGAGEKAELVLLVGMAVAAEVAVKLVSLPRLARFLGIALLDLDKPRAGESRRRSASGMDAATVARRARSVDRLYRAWPRKSSCLRRALVLGYRVRKANPVLAIGVANDDGAIRAHAWIEVGGEVVGEDTGEFAPLRSHRDAS
jgi:hypothetical protein